MEEGRVVTHNPMRLVQRDLANKFPAGVYPGSGERFTAKERAEFASDTSTAIGNIVWIGYPRFRAKAALHRGLKCYVRSAD